MTEIVLFIAVSTPPHTEHKYADGSGRAYSPRSLCNLHESESLLSRTQAVYDHLPQGLLVEVGISRFDTASLPRRMPALRIRASEVEQAVIRHITYRHAAAEYM
jgi:hypothetical protein